VVAALSGDRQAISDVVSGTAAFAAEFYLTGGAAGVKSGVKLAVRSAELIGEGARVTLRVGAEAALTGGKDRCPANVGVGSGRRLVAEGFAIAKLQEINAPLNGAHPEVLEHAELMRSFRLSTRERGAPPISSSIESFVASVTDRCETSCRPWDSTNLESRRQTPLVGCTPSC
jgi:hypothetical protein